jgi:hypothetical protein
MVERALPLVPDLLELYIHLIDLIHRPLRFGALGGDGWIGSRASGQHKKTGYRRYRDKECYELSFSKAVHGLLTDSENRAGRPLTSLGP